MESTAWGTERGNCLFTFMQKSIPGIRKIRLTEQWILTTARPSLSLRKCTLPCKLLHEMSEQSQAPSLSTTISPTM